MVITGKRRGYITLEELNGVLPRSELSAEEIESVMTALSDLGITVIGSGQHVEEPKQKTDAGAQAESATVIREKIPSEPESGLGCVSLAANDPSAERVVEQEPKVYGCRCANSLEVLVPAAEDWRRGNDLGECRGMTRPYISFQIDRLEAEFERAREESDRDALRHLREELPKRKVTPRTTRLRQLLGEDLASQVGNEEEAGEKPDGNASSGRTTSTGQVSGNGCTDRSEYTRTERSAERPRVSPGSQRFRIVPLSFTPTPEQEQAVEAFKTGESLKINAYAGAGKTSTLQLLARSTPQTGQYLAFNKKIVFDSRGKFPTSVDCATTHAMALRGLRGRYARDKLFERLSPNRLVDILKLKNWRVQQDVICRQARLGQCPHHGSLAAAPETDPDRHSRIGNAPNGTVLARTNATTISAIIEALDGGKKPHLVGGTEDLVNMLRGVKDLKAGEPSSVPEFFGFENWQQVVEFVRSGEGEELLTFVNLVEARGEGQLLWALNKVVDEDECDFVVSTRTRRKAVNGPPFAWRMIS